MTELAAAVYPAGSATDIASATARPCKADATHRRERYPFAATRHEVQNAAMAEQEARVRRRRDAVRGLAMHARYAGTQDAGTQDAGSPDAASPAPGPIVLVHGLVVSSSFLVPALARLGRHHPSYAPDLPGYGLSAKPPQQYGLERQADYLAGWMDRLGLRRAVLVGCSLGSQIVSYLALRRPELVQRAMLMSPTMDLSARDRRVALARWVRELPYELPMLPLMLRDYARAGIRRAMHTFELALADEPEARLPRMTMPTLVLRGELDPIVTQQWAEQVTALIPAGRLQVVEGQTHAINFTAPAEFTAIVRQFVAEGTRRKGDGSDA